MKGRHTRNVGISRNNRRGAAQDRDQGDSVSRLEDSPTRRPWLIAVPTIIVVLLGVAWSAFWYWSSSAAGATMTAWRTREAEAGRVYGCASTSFGGYPFRIEVTCTEPSVDDRA